MQDKLYSVFSPSAHGILGAEVLVVDANQEPLTALKVIIDGISSHSTGGVWLGPYNQIPRVQGFAEHDIVILDAGMRVIQAVSLRPEDHFPHHSDLAASMLVLPPGSLAATPVQIDESLIIYVPDIPGALPSPAAIAAKAPAIRQPAKGSSSAYKPIAVGNEANSSGATTEKAKEAPKEPRIKRFLRWIDPTLVNPPEMRISMRRHTPELVAYRLIAGREPEAFHIGDISSTGVYLITDKHWQVGEHVKLALQRLGPFQHEARLRVEVEAETVRAGEEGMGLRFLLPLGMDLHLWESMHESGADMSKPEYIVSEMRYAEALAFLRQICPLSGDAMNQMFEKELGLARVACAVDIVLIAKQMMGVDRNAIGLRAHPGVVLRIIEHGSWAEFDLIKQYWGGLLASSCTEDGQDISNLPHVDSFALMRVMHFQLLAEGCRCMDEGEEPACHPDALPKITGTSDPTPIYRAIALLGELGLMEKSTKSTYAFEEKIRIVPTEQGRNLMARCNGKFVAA
ncbi:MAG: PilZ domain-containing protein [Acidobacteriota bacterium]|nr:PilZ domain-containing protein [Acidobacteriota bacterium]